MEARITSKRVAAAFVTFEQEMGAVSARVRGVSVEHVIVSRRSFRFKCDTHISKSVGLSTLSVSR